MKRLPNNKTKFFVDLRRGRRNTFSSWIADRPHRGTFLSMTIFPNMLHLINRLCSKRVSDDQI